MTINVTAEWAIVMLSLLGMFVTSLVAFYNLKGDVRVLKAELRGIRDQVNAFTQITTHQGG